MTSKVEEFALNNMTASLGKLERIEQLRKMQAACDTRTLQDIVEDNRRSQVPRPLDRAEAAAQMTNGWIEPRPLAQPPGIDHIDRIAAAFDKRDRAKGLL